MSNVVIVHLLLTRGRQTQDYYTWKEKKKRQRIKRCLVNHGLILNFLSIKYKISIFLLIPYHGLYRVHLSTWYTRLRNHYNLKSFQSSPLPRNYPKKKSLTNANTIPSIYERFHNVLSFLVSLAKETLSRHSFAILNCTPAFEPETEWCE